MAEFFLRLPWRPSAQERWKLSSPWTLAWVRRQQGKRTLRSRAFKRKTSPTRSSMCSLLLPMCRLVFLLSTSDCAPHTLSGPVSGAGRVVLVKICWISLWKILVCLIVSQFISFLWITQLTRNISFLEVQGHSLGKPVKRFNHMWSVLRGRRDSHPGRNRLKFQHLKFMSPSKIVTFFFYRIVNEGIHLSRE